MSEVPPVPRQAGPYRLLTELGRGGMGRVMLGVAPDGRPAAVKLVHARHAADDGFRTRFRREVAASRQVSGAHTAAVLDADADAAQPWLASVFVAGPALGAAVEQTGALPEPALHRLAVGLATALAEIHAVGLVHRDLKPENVLLAEDGARVIDFGIARAAEAGDATELTGTGWVVGSPPFMSPEQAQSLPLTGASDVFSLGSVLVLAATGRVPFPGPSPLQTLYRLVHAEPDLTGVPASLHGIVARCLAKAPEDRPTPGQLLLLLGTVAPAARPWPPAVHRLIDDRRAAADALLDRAPGPAAPTVPPATGPMAPVAAPTSGPTAVTAGPAPRRTARRRIAWVAAVALLAVGVGSWLALRQDDGPGPPDAYLTMPTCAQATPGVPLRDQWRPDQDKDRDDADSARLECSWYGKDRPMADGWNSAASAVVSWELFRSNPSTNATRKQQQDFDSSSKGRVENGFGDGAYWTDADTGRASCQLNVRSANLVVRIYLTRTAHPDCEAEARTLVRPVLAAVPRRTG
ncbi:serine/threonine-protein kinase [Kitasatospora sp. NPDC058965]|uniref:serine/threonine-protein kinase n=1 Tax=Kitasatospora sp. NPDC058965 TaxID=3346682 RepID=UPI003697E954